ncbi:hypothetical protein VTG60DRAFT_2751 [Thermothelomyces hinnuleus]
MASKLSLGYLWASSLFGGQEPGSICEMIDRAIPNRTTFPASPRYAAAQASYYSGQERELQPECIFTPTDAKEVSLFVRLVTEVQGQGGEQGLGQQVVAGWPTQFAIRGGGHAVFAGAANVAGGVTVDLRALNSFSLSDDRKTATIGAGAVWSEIYPQLVPHNVTVMGGRVAGVGAGGFLLGGGISHLSRRHGWACDNVLGYEIVLANGDIVYATASSHPDLWLALKGGSNNFGIVTRFDIATRPLGGMWGGTLIFEYTPPVHDAQAAAFSDFMSPDNFDDDADMFVALFFQNPGGTYAAGNVLYYGKPIENPPVFRPFTTIPSPLVNTLRTTHVADLSTEQASTLPPDANRAINMVYSFKNPSAAVYSELFRKWEEGTKRLADVAGLQVALLLQPHPVSDARNSLGLPPGGEDLVMSVITVSYAERADDDRVRAGLRAIIDAHEDILRREGVYIPWKYLNYADKLQDPIGSYGDEVKARLQAVSKKYDPHGLFQTGVPGGFKLFD